ncbi:uncharacterized protein LOC121504357 [Cheilinus undulatus]|uniref:uncharacterized protein LOC121504357 n=1 Tax=Cheilinus undulatus TaxID=241271 RepID=UPI001BD2182E|nr:uncharacterized protein LOC121504357 [Cheilinus undulatus]
MTETELEVPTALIEEKKLQQEDAPFLKPSFTEVSLDQDFFILLLQLLGAFHDMISVWFLVGLASSFTVTVIVGKKLRKRNMDLEKKMPQLQSDFQGHESLVNTLMEVNAELENMRDRLKEQLEEMERKREENKLKLQALETEIREKYMSYDKKEELLREKENLLQEQRRLDHTKKDIKIQVLNMEKLHGPIEIQLARLYQK